MQVFYSDSIPFYTGSYYSHFMALESETLITLLQDGLPGADIRIEDLRGDGDHYAAYITYQGFTGKNRVQQHQMVYAALQGKMGNELHALQIHTSIPSQ